MPQKRVIEQKDVTSDEIISIIKEFLANKEKIAVMSQKAAELAVKDTPERILSVVDKLYSKSIKKQKSWWIFSLITLVSPHSHISNKETPYGII